MKTKSMITMAAAAVVTTLAMPGFSAPTVVGDEALDSISGKAASNTDTITGNSAVTLSTGDGSNGNVQVGYFQWNDDHGGDLSDHKGANDTSGQSSAVQQNVSATLNIFGWGAAAQVSSLNNTSTIGGDQIAESWGTLFVGGF